MSKLVLVLAILLLAHTAGAYPNMIRLGYVACATCHASPQGGGVLTRYGRGIDYAQTIRAGEPPDAERPSDALSRFLYDVRLQMAVDHQQESDAEYSFNTNFRTAVAVNARNRIVYAFGVRSPALAINRRMGAATLGMSRLYWMYQPRDGVAFVVGRDELPTGLGLPGANAFYKAVNNPNVSATPTQAKLFWWNRRFQLAGYGYGPDGNETKPQYEARGAGAMGGINVWNDRAVIGLTARVSKADAFDRRNAGVFARIGFTDHVGVLAEHDVTGRVLNTGRSFVHLAGHDEVFFVPVNWLQTSLAVEHLDTVGGARTRRVLPAAELRLTPNFRLQFSTRNVYADMNSKTYSILLQVKAE